jgi:UDP-N-acetylmuramate dehydrogenase
MNPAPLFEGGRALDKPFREPFPERLEKNVPLAPHTTFGIGGPAAYFFSPDDLEDFSEALRWAVGERIPFFILGSGSNVLIHDSGFDGLVIRTASLKKLELHGTVVEAECGVPIDVLVDLSLAHGLKGLEFAAGLPGTVGGALFMNARAFEGAFSDITESVTALRVEGTEVREIRLGRGDFCFGYKRSVFQEGFLYVYSARFSLGPAPEAAIGREIEKNRARRHEMGQFLFPNAGCIFKNDYRIGVPTGKIIEELGFKGRRIGDAEVYEKHANFIVNRGSAKASDVYRLICWIESEAKKKLNIELTREIRLIGNWRDAEKYE